jgi:multidrug efflux pump subunit AcrB
VTHFAAISAALVLIAIFLPLSFAQRIAEAVWFKLTL